MRIDEIIKGVVPTGFGFLYATYKEANKKIDKVTSFPLCVLIAQISGSFQVDGYYSVRDTQNVMLLLLDIDEDGNTDSPTSVEIIDRMKNEGLSIISRLVMSKDVEEVGGQIKYQPLVQEFDRKLTGVSFDLSVKLSGNVCF